MAYTKEQRAINQARGYTNIQRNNQGSAIPMAEQRTAIATGMYLPNLSGLFTLTEVYHPEYEGAVFVEGSSTLANMGFGLENASNVAYTYYDWEYSGAALSDIEIKKLINIPATFKGFQGNALTIYFKTETTTNTDQKIDFYVYKNGITGTVVSDLANVSGTAETWDSHTFTDLSSLGLTAGDVIQVRAVLHSKSGNYVRLGKIEVNYLVCLTP